MTAGPIESAAEAINKSADQMNTATITLDLLLSIVPLPLTLTLCPGEQEQQANIVCCFNNRPANPVIVFFASRDTILSLRAGEGRGEWQRDAGIFISIPKPTLQTAAT